MAGRSGRLTSDGRFKRSLSAFVQRMAATPDLNELLRHAFEIVRDIVPVDAMFVAALTGERSYLKLLETDLDDNGNRVFCPPRAIDSNSTKVLETLDQHRYLLVNRTKEELLRLRRGFSEREGWAPVGNPKRRSASLLFVPIWQGAKYAGALSVQSYSLNAYCREDAERLVVLADYIGLAIRHARLVERRRPGRSVARPHRRFV